MTNFSYTWETSEIHTKTKYKAGTGKEISADIGIHIGLRGVNITLKGIPTLAGLVLPKYYDLCVNVKKGP